MSRPPHAERAASFHNVDASRPPGHIDSLDGLRGIAVLMILVVHANIFRTADFVAPDSMFARRLLQLAQLGWTGVDLFFVLSGMLITGILLDSRAAPGYFRSFYARRTLRIFPLYYVALVVFTILLPWVGRAVLHETVRSRPDTPWVWAYMTNIAIARAESSAVVPPLTSHFWSLGVEEQFYLLWPFLVWWCSPRSLRRVVVAMIVGAPMLRILLSHLGGHENAIAVLLPTRIDTLALGALIAITARAPGGLGRWRIAAPIALAACVVGFLVVGQVGHGIENVDPMIQRYGLTCIAVGYAALIVMVMESAPRAALTRMLSLRSLRWVGSRGYAVYVWHPLFVHALLYLGWQRQPAFMSLPLGIQYVTVLAGLFVVSMIAAEVSWRVIEVPFLSLKRYFPRPHALGAPGAIGGRVT